MGKFVMKTTKNGKIKFDLKASNGQIVATKTMPESSASV